MRRLLRCSPAAPPAELSSLRRFPAFFNVNRLTIVSRRFTIGGWRTRHRIRRPANPSFFSQPELWKRHFSRSPVRPVVAGLRCAAPRWLARSSIAQSAAVSCRLFRPRTGFRPGRRAPTPTKPFKTRAPNRLRSGRPVPPRRARGQHRRPRVRPRKRAFRRRRPPPLFYRRSPRRWLPRRPWPRPFALRRKWPARLLLRWS